jgi:hypothetical protein
MRKLREGLKSREITGGEYLRLWAGIEIISDINANAHG